jgi:hypothetical protein
MYSDNYFGVSNFQNPPSDTTYNVGPTLDFKIASQRIAFNFSGYATKDIINGIPRMIPMKHSLNQN